MCKAALVGAVLALLPLILAAWPPERPSGDRPTPEQLAWQDAELGMFCHFGTNTFTDREWGDGTASPDVFNPTEFDPRQWVAAAKAAGMKYLVVTAKHHDGFCLWPTQQTDYCVRSSKWRRGKGDVLREVADACHAAGIKLGIYLSPWDRHEPRYADNKAYDQYYMAQMTELLTNYGEVFEFWADGAGGEGHVYDWAAYYRHLKKLQPSCLWVIAGVPDIRWVGNEDGLAPETLWNITRVGEKAYWLPAECDARIRAHWFWHPDDANTLKSVAELLHMYHASVGHGANLLLNVAPDNRGLLPEQDVARLKELRAALDAIYAQDLLAGCPTRASSEVSGHGASAALDGRLDTYWLAAEGDERPWIEVDCRRKITFDRVVMQETIQVGQHVQRYAVDGWDGKAWQRLVEATTLGHKKIDILSSPATALRLRLVVLKAKGGPVGLRALQAYLAPQQWRDG